MFKTLLVAGRDRHRLKEIAQVASRFGLGVLLARLGLARGDNGSAENPQTLPTRTRLALEALGPTFVKLGQILATRSDLLPPEWIAELEQLHSRAPTLDFEQLRPAVEEALGQPPETAFASFDPQPLAAASMAQIHRATLPDGRHVVLKVRRPGVRPQIEADLRLIAQLASIAESASADAQKFAPAAMVRQLADAVLEELDFTVEGRNADRMREDFAHEPRVVVPEIHWLWTSETLLVMDFVEGVAPRDAATLRSAGIDPEAIAELGADIVLDMVLINGRFHADPHPGNLLCLAGNRIALLDLGMIGHVSPRRREEFISFVQALNSADAAHLADVLTLWSERNDPPPDRVRSAAERLTVRHGGGRLLLSAMMTDFMKLMRDEGMTLPPDLLLIFKALITIDGVLSGIQPGYDLSDAIRRSSLRIMMARLSPQRWVPVLETLAQELVRIGADAPRLLRAATRRLEYERGSKIVRDDFSAAIMSAGRWVAGAVLIGSMVIACALIFS